MSGIFMADKTETVTRSDKFSCTTQELVQKARGIRTVAYERRLFLLLWREYLGLPLTLISKSLISYLYSLPGHCPRTYRGHCPLFLRLMRFIQLF